MKKSALLFSAIVLLLASCNNKSNTTQTTSTIKPHPFIQQLYLFGESADESFAGQLPGDSGGVFGAAYFTKKGNVIYNTMDMDGDTVSYFWGKYIVTDTTITYQLTDEFYYPGKWDARWDANDPDYKKGKTRKVQPMEVRLHKSKDAWFPLYRPYTAEERKQAAKKFKGTIPFGLVFQPYTETKDMKFYTWFYKQIPALAEL